MQEKLPSPLAEHLADVVVTIMDEIRPELVSAAISGQRGETTNQRHADNFLSVHDLRMHNRYQQLLTARIESFIYASEEADPLVIGPNPDPDLCILVDPLDTSELAVRGLHGYTHVLAYSRKLRKPIAAVVGDIFHHIRLYIAAQDENGNDHALAVTADGNRHSLFPAPPRPLADALVMNYMMKPANRFSQLAQQHRLLASISAPDRNGERRGRVGVDFGSVSLCHVAAGFTDAMIEFAKGFAIWDLLPGHYILHAAGGHVSDLSGSTLPLSHGFDSVHAISRAMNTRQKFIAASGPDLANEISRQLTL